MCCPSYKSALNKLLKKFGDKDEIICYKQVSVTPNSSITERVLSGGVCYPKNDGYRDGVLRTHTRFRTYNKIKHRGTRKIYEGLHVYLKRPFIISNSYQIVIPIYCRKEDLIGTDGYTAVFRKVRITRQAYLKACKHLGLTPLPKSKQNQEHVI